MTSVSGMVVRASEVKPLAKEFTLYVADNMLQKLFRLKGMDVKIPVQYVIIQIVNKEILN